MNAAEPVYTVEPKRLQALILQVVSLGYESGTLADLLTTKADTARSGDDLSDHIHFAAWFLERLQDALSGIEGEMNDMVRPDTVLRRACDG